MPVNTGTQRSSRCAFPRGFRPIVLPHPGLWKYMDQDSDGLHFSPGVIFQREKEPRDSVVVDVQSLSRVWLLRPHESQHTRLPCPSLSPGVCSTSCPLSQWCHPTISSSVVPFSLAFSLSQHQGLLQWVVAKKCRMCPCGKKLPRPEKGRWQGRGRDLRPARERFNSTETAGL